jgi:transcriptional regulator with XRE-family HTH domain
MRRPTAPDNRLREFRQASRWTLEDVADRLCGLSVRPIALDRNAVSRHELGVIAKPKKEYRRLYAQLYGVPEDELWPPGDFGSLQSARADPFVKDASALLESLTGWDAGRTDTEIASRRSTLTERGLRAVGRKRGTVSRQQIATALADYYGAVQAPGHRLYSVTFDGGPSVHTSILTAPSWLDLTVPLATGRDLLMTTMTVSSDAPQGLTRDAADRAAQRLAEIQILNTRLVDTPLYRLLSVDRTEEGISGTLGLTGFATYALTADLLEAELLDALGSDVPTSMPLRDSYLPNLSAVLDLPARECVGGVVALCAIARPGSRLRGPADFVLLVQERSGSVVNAARRLAVIPKGFHQPMTDLGADAQLGATLRREMEEELFGREDIDNTVTTTGRRADPMHPSRLSEPMRWLDAHPESFRMECTGFGINLVSGNYEFAALVVIDDEEFWTRYGGTIEANWETEGLRQYSSLDRDLLTQLAHDPAWSNEGLFAYLAGLHRLGQLHPDRTNLPRESAP